MGYVLTNTDTFQSIPFFTRDDSLAGQSHVETYCLKEGNYKFTIYDSYGDGICCSNGNGEYVVTSNAVIIAQGGEFDYMEETVFKLPV